MNYLNYLSQIPLLFLHYVLPAVLVLVVIYGLLQLVAKILKIKRLASQPYAVIEHSSARFY